MVELLVRTNRCQSYREHRSYIASSLPSMLYFFWWIVFNDSCFLLRVEYDGTSGTPRDCNRNRINYICSFENFGSCCRWHRGETQFCSRMATTLVRRRMLEAYCRRLRSLPHSLRNRYRMTGATVGATLRQYPPSQFRSLSNRCHGYPPLLHEREKDELPTQWCPCHRPIDWHQWVFYEGAIQGI